MCICFNKCVLFEIKNWNGAIRTRNRLLWEAPWNLSHCYHGVQCEVRCIRQRAVTKEKSLWWNDTQMFPRRNTLTLWSSSIQGQCETARWELFPQFAAGSELPLPIRISPVQASPARSAITSKLPAAPLALRRRSHAVQGQRAPRSTDHESQDKSYTEVSGELRCVQPTTRRFPVRMLQCHCGKADNSRTAAPLCILMILLEWP